MATEIVEKLFISESWLILFEVWNGLVQFLPFFFDRKIVQKIPVFKTKTEA